jgi:beta-lactamase superfamily II metal-dependent hydrolase
VLHIDDRRLMFTGDAGIPALARAAERYESTFCDFSENPLSFFQPPHHGSRHNLGPTILDRLLGDPSYPFGPGTFACISSAKAAPKHPSPKVVNALARRGCRVAATEGANLWLHYEAPPREEYGPLTHLPILDESDDDD